MKTTFNILSTIFVAQKNDRTLMRFYWLNSLRNANETVRIIVFNCENREDFKKLLEKDLIILEELKGQKSASLVNIENQIRVIETWLQEMSTPAFIKEPSDEILKAVSDAVKKQLTKEDVIYLSGLV